jgi:hypothetical protein
MADILKKTTEIPKGVCFFSTLIDMGYDYIPRPIPETAPDRYISGYISLNLPSPSTDTFPGTHADDYLYSLPDNPVPFSVWGNVPDNTRNTLSIYGDYGISDYSEIFRDLGFEHNYDAVYAANHLRAIVDVVYSYLFDLPPSFLKPNTPMPGNQLVYDYVYDIDKSLLFLEKIKEMRPFLPEERRPYLDHWLQYEEELVIYGYE